MEFSSCAQLLDYAENRRHLVIRFKGSKSPTFCLSFGSVLFSLSLVRVCRSLYFLYTFTVGQYNSFFFPIVTGCIEIPSKVRGDISSDWRYG